MTGDFELINNIFCALADRETESDSPGITDIEQVVLLVWHAAGIIGNGGFRYFFECGLPLRETENAYARIGVEDAVSIFQRLHDLFPHCYIPEDYDERMEIVEKFYSEEGELLNRLESDFYKTDILMERQLAAWIRVHKDVFAPARTK